MEKIQGYGIRHTASPRPGQQPSRSGFAEELRRQVGSRYPEATPTASTSGANHTTDSQLIPLGTISRTRPTVSHLLIGNSVYKKDCWKIIHSAVNREKPFEKLKVGEPIYLDPAGKEILWGQAIAAHQTGTASPDPVSAPAPLEEKAALSSNGNPEPVTPAPAGVKNLSVAVTAYMGTPYDRLDCYELLVEGLKSMGLRYAGKDGLKDQLIQKAMGESLPLNAYLTGEGLADALSTGAYKNTFSVSNPETEAGRFFGEIESQLEPGMILSFSTLRNGHTGVISRSEGAWTFLNSGLQDHPVRFSGIDKGVGEEDLKAEITSWFRRARDRNEPLYVSLGRLSRHKLRSFTDGSGIRTTL